MTGIFVKIAPSGQSKCKRCGRWFQPKSADQEYGPTCARKMRGQTDLSALDHVYRRAVIV